MESNGEPGKIHVSSATADELVLHGCQDWLSERENPIDAKGKGLMTTYWVNVANAKSTTTRSTTDAFTESDEDVSDIWNASSLKSDQSGRLFNASGRFDQSERLNASKMIDNSSRLHAIDETEGHQIPGGMNVETEVEV